MTKNQIIISTKKFVEKKLKNASSGHGWWHTHRVWKMAKRLAKEEKANSFVVEISALLHDVWDWKFCDEATANKELTDWLKNSKIGSLDAKHISRIVNNVSFKGVAAKNKIDTLEGRVVQDADRLDAIGAIGIARTFAYGGHTNRKIYDPDIKPVLRATEKTYKSLVGTSVNHFHEKLFLLKDLMHTKTAKKIAKKRHEFMRIYLTRFLSEWEGKK